jgi:predicted ATPase
MKLGPVPCDRLRSILYPWLFFYQRCRQRVGHAERSEDEMRRTPVLTDGHVAPRVEERQVAGFRSGSCPVSSLGMLTRLKVSGFKNLVDVDVWFGPFTCIAGANGVGKSNLFDAITFLRLLSSKSLLDAALSVRDENLQSGDVRSLFFQMGETHARLMTFEAWMITPKEGVDDLRQRVKASNTLLKYELHLAYRGERAEEGPLEIRHERLTHVTKGDAHEMVRFDNSVEQWRNAVVVAQRRSREGNGFIETEGHTIRVHQDQKAGKPQERLASILPRTVLSSVNASESPTVVVARNEMASWRFLQLEPTALRSPDPFRADRSVSTSGSHLAATLHALDRSSAPNGGVKPTAREAVARRVAELVHDVREVWVDEDHTRETLTLMARLSDGTPHAARSLSDGTLRFLALAIIEQTPQSGGLYCLEEPENGIHPQRIPAMLRLLSDIAVDPSQPPSENDNPLRQVMINTHAPQVVSEVPDESLIVARNVHLTLSVDQATSMGIDLKQVGRPTHFASFSALADTWRTKVIKDGTPLMPEASRGDLLAYLNPVPIQRPDSDQPPSRSRRVIDRDDVRQLLLFVNPN